MTVNGTLVGIGNYSRTSLQTREQSHDTEKKHVINRTSFSYLCKLPFLIRKLVPETLRDLRPRCHPNTLLLTDILDKILQRLETPRPSNNPAMQANCHHLRFTRLPFLIQHIERVLEVLVERPGAAETGTLTMELEVIAVVGVGDHEAAFGGCGVAFLRQIGPVGHVVGVCVTRPEKLFTHFFINEGNESAALRGWA
jgi:hypothetical protein